MQGVELVPKRHAVALRLLEALKEEAKVALDPGTSEALLYTDALARARLIEVTCLSRTVVPLTVASLVPGYSR